MRTEWEVVDSFHRLYYNKGQMKAHGDTNEIKVEMAQTYCSIPIQKNPLDLWVVQEIIHEREPDLIIEMGTASGGSALYYAHQLGLLGAKRPKKVLSIDITPKIVPWHPSIEYYTGDSTAPDTVDYVRSYVDDYERVMIILDDDHGSEHVLYELLLYFKLVTKGQYIIVEDTNIGWPLAIAPDGGPGRAVVEFLEDDRVVGKFSQDRSREKFLLTFNPGGFLECK